jgi:tetratricopeptide (TPR) repeat protein
MKTDFITPVIELAIRVMDRGESWHELHKEVVTFLENAAPPPLKTDADGAEQLACLLARGIWSAMPNPSRQFAIERLPAPGRNDRCVIDLGCKHKQCCGGLPAFPPIDADLCWATLCEVLPAKRLPEILASKRLPDGLLATVAHRLVESEPERVRAMLEPRFAGALNPKDKHLGELLLALCDAYDALEKPKLKHTLLTRVAHEAQGQTRADALQRLATMAADKGDYESAWAFFADAQRASPDDLSLSHLEIIMLLSEGRHAQARERARFWIAKIQRSGHDEDMEPMLHWLRQIAQGQEPEDAMAELVSPKLGEWAQRLMNAIKAGLARPIDSSHLRLVAIDDAKSGESFDPAAFEKSMMDRLVKMGASKKDAREQVQAMLAELKARTREDGEETAPADENIDRNQLSSAPEFALGTSAAMAGIEQEWHRAWPLGKPFSTHPMPHELTDVWAVPQVEFWVAFLETQPMAFDSPDILDDVLIAVTLMPDDPSGWSAVATKQKLFRRAATLLLPVCEGDVTLPWAYEPNRPALRLLVESAFDHLDRGDRDTLPMMRKILRLNPNDNHGLRDIVVNQLLLEDQDADALAIIDQYKDDSMPALSFGKVLALYRQGKLGEAEHALANAIKYGPKILPWLLPARKAKPKAVSEYGIQVGGDEEAWHYREDMREAWAATDGALAWLKRCAG